MSRMKAGDTQLKLESGGISDIAAQDAGKTPSVRRVLVCVCLNDT